MAVILVTRSVMLGCSVPPPHSPIITHADESVTSLAERGLSDGRRALGVGEDRVVDETRLTHIQVPHVGPPHLVTQGHHLLMLVQREPHEPDLTVLEPNLVDHSHLVLRGRLGNFTLDILLSLHSIAAINTTVQYSGLPAHDGVLTRLGENIVSKPLATVHIIPVNVSGAEVREVAELGGEDFLSVGCSMVVGELDCCLDGVGVHTPHLETVVHAAGDDLGSVHVEVCT